MILADYTVSLSGTLLDAVQTIDHNHSRCCIVTEDDKVVGILSEGDILRALMKGSDVRAPIAKYFNASFKFLHESNRKKALELFRRHGITLIPIVDREFRLKGVLTWKDILDDGIEA